LILSCHPAWPAAAFRLAAQAFFDIRNASSI
jgi:hypothetical protein